MSEALLKENTAESTPTPPVGEPTWKPGVTKLVSEEPIKKEEKKDGGEPTEGKPGDSKTVEAPTDGGEKPAPAEAKPAETPKSEEDKTRQFINLSRKERKLLEEKKALEADKAKYAKVIAAIEKAKEDPKAILEAAGITYDDLTKAMLGEKPVDKADAVAKEVAELKAQQEKERVAKEEADFKAGVEAIRQTSGQLITEKKEEYELLHAMGDEGKELVTEIILKYIQKVGKPLPFEEALRLGEEELQAQLKRFSGTNKLKNLFTPPPANGNGNGAAKEPGQTATERPTLTNAQATAAPHGAKRKLSREESLKEIAGMLKFTEV